MHRVFTILVLLALPFSHGFAAESVVAKKLSKRSFSKLSKTHGIVLFSVGWNREWNCGGFENAQLRAIGFDIEPYVGSKKSNILVKGRSGQNDYAFLVKPGSYGITNAHVKVAASMTDVRHLKLTHAELLKNKQPIGGTFEVRSDEIVYIGHFGLDCTYRPIPWRYYLSDEQSFKEYMDKFMNDYQYVTEKAVTYRLFDTKEFGSPFALKE